MLARPCRREVPKDANPWTRPCGTAPASAAGPKPWFPRGPRPEGLSSRASDVETPLSNPPKWGLAGAARRARTTHGWQTVGQFSLPQPRRTGVTIGLLPACFAGHRPELGFVPNTTPLVGFLFSIAYAVPDLLPPASRLFPSPD